jgi:pyridoxamine 5'-phosphate oxidase
VPDDLDLADLRRSYEAGGLRRADLSRDPMAQLRRWLDDAVADDRIGEATAMHLATVDEDGSPDGRVVLCKGLDHGVVFYTNHTSDKARHLAVAGRAAVTFHWDPLERQVRLRGPVARVSDEESDAYFASRPRGSQIGAWASDQSEPIASREALEAHARRVAERFADGAPVPRPPHWGGYRLVPDRVEFWQGRPDRLHDRFRYVRHAGGWTITRLQP